MNTLKNKAVVITGASCGLGRHIAEKIAAESCHLILLARD
ncbi:MAG TPA: SDR family NAD(P)-dependent oxidoreductase [Gammaproteobacteria bacterium]